MSKINLKNISKKYDNGIYAVKDANISIEQGEFVIIVGPSGCGKSTILRMIAGLEDITDGELWVDGELFNFKEPGERELAMVFQNYALYPNMTVYKNLAFSLEIRGVSKAEVKQRVESIAKILGLSEELNKRPNALSGGQRQRVAIGNAIIRNPEILLMDEPLSNLDAKLRGQMRVEIAKLHKELGNTIIYVTHDQVEAMTLGTKIIVMNSGEIHQVDTPKEIYYNPRNQFVAGFMGSPAMSFLEMKIKTADKKMYLYSDWIEIECSEFMQEQISKKLTSDSITVGIRPEDFVTSNEICELREDFIQIQVKVEYRELLGDEANVHFSIGDNKCCMKCGADVFAEVGEIIPVYINIDRLYLFDTYTTDSILYNSRLKCAD